LIPSVEVKKKLRQNSVFQDRNQNQAAKTRRKQA